MLRRDCAIYLKVDTNFLVSFIIQISVKPRSKAKKEAWISLTVIQRETASVAILHQVLLWEMIQADAVKETTGNPGIVLTEGVVREK